MPDFVIKWKLKGKDEWRPMGAVGMLTAHGSQVGMLGRGAVDKGKTTKWDYQAWVHLDNIVLMVVRQGRLGCMSRG